MNCLVMPTERVQLVNFDATGPPAMERANLR